MYIDTFEFHYKAMSEQLHLYNICIYLHANLHKNMYI